MSELDARILIVDDSAFMRKILSEQISTIEGLTVAGTAVNGEMALEKISILNPDAVTLDVEMPGMNGLEVVKRIREHSDIPVFMISSISGTEITIQALEAGATDFIKKPENLLREPSHFQKQIETKMQSLLQKNATFEKEEGVKWQEKIEKNTAIEWDQLSPKVIVMGASTGGPRVIMEIIKNLPADFPYPILIVQHMPAGFTASFAERLNASAKLTVKEAKGGEKLKSGNVYLAPGNYHMTILNHTIHLHQQNKLHGVRPAVDFLFETAGEQFGADVIGIILTGMGRDGTEGMQTIKRFGGVTIAQNKKTSTVYGMPGHAVKTGVVDISTDVQGISCILNKLVKVKE